MSTPNEARSQGNTLGSAAYTVAFYCWAIAVALALIPTLLLPRAVLRVGVRFWTRGIAFLLRHLAGIRWRLEGWENAPEGNYILVCKHQSEWESEIFINLLRDPVYIMKKELARIPVYGLYAYKMGMIIIDREGGARALRRMLRDAEAAVAANRTLVIFPEGTRVNPRERVPYQSGVAALYRTLGLPVLPMVHNSGLHWPKRTFRKIPGTIVLRALAPIPPGLSRAEFMTRLEETMEGAWRELYREETGEELVQRRIEFYEAAGLPPPAG